MMGLGGKVVFEFEKINWFVVVLGDKLLGIIVDF